MTGVVLLLAKILAQILARILAQISTHDLMDSWGIT